MIKKLGLYAALLSGLSVSQNTLAETYIGFGIGQTSYAEVTESEESLYWQRGGSFEVFDETHTDTAFRFFAGYALNQHVSFEFGYLDLGQATLFVKETTPSTYADPEIDTLNVDLAYSGFYLGVLPTFEYKMGIALRVKLSAYFWDTNGEWNQLTEYTRSSDGEDYRYRQVNSLNDSGTDLMIGFGLSYDKFSIEFEKIRLPENTTDLLTLNVRF